MASLDASLRLANHSREHVDLDVAWELGADYAGLMEVSSGTRQQEAPVGVEHEPHEALYTYTHPELPYRTRVAGAGPGEWRASSDRVGARLRLAPRERVELALRVEPIDSEPFPDADGIARREQRLREWISHFARVEVPGNRAAERIISRAVGDLASLPLLDGEKDEWLAMQAGMPLYPALFGRDSTTTTWQAAMLDRGEALDHVLTRLGRLQGERVDDWSDEQPESLKAGLGDRFTALVDGILPHLLGCETARRVPGLNESRAPSLPPRPLPRAARGRSRRAGSPLSAPL